MPYKSLTPITQIKIVIVILHSIINLNFYSLLSWCIFDSQFNFK